MREKDINISLKSSVSVIFIFTNCTGYSFKSLTTAGGLTFVFLQNTWALKWKFPLVILIILEKTSKIDIFFLKWWSFHFLCVFILLNSSSFPWIFGFCFGDIKNFLCNLIQRFNFQIFPLRHPSLSLFSITVAL